MPPRRREQECRLVGERDNRAAAHGHDGVLGLAAQPVAGAHLVLRPRQDCFLLKAPRIKQRERLAHVMIRRPQPEDRVLIRRTDSDRYC